MGRYSGTSPRVTSWARDTKAGQLTPAGKNDNRTDEFLACPGVGGIGTLDDFRKCFENCPRTENRLAIFDSLSRDQPLSEQQVMFFPGPDSLVPHPEGRRLKDLDIPSDRLGKLKSLIGTHTLGLTKLCPGSKLPLKNL